MMQLAASTRQALCKRRKCYYGNIAALSQPVLAVFGYSPTDNDPPLSIVFDGELGPKCWMSERTVREINGNGPRLGHYGDYEYDGHQFYGFSIQAFSQSDFDNADRIESICRRLYEHIVWPNP